MIDLVERVFFYPFFNANPKRTIQGRVLSTQNESLFDRMELVYCISQKQVSCATEAPTFLTNFIGGFRILLSETV